MAGRPPKFSPERAAQIVLAAAGFNNRDACAAYAGVAPSTLYRWIEAGRTAKNGPFREFWEDLKKAEADAELAMVGRIQTAARVPEHWTAAAWLLERRYPSKWGRQDRATLKDIEDATRQMAERAGLTEEETEEAVLHARELAL